MVIDDIIKELQNIRDKNGGNLLVVDEHQNTVVELRIKDDHFDDDAPPSVVIICQRDPYDD